jgi:hypothetical protein
VNILIQNLVENLREEEQKRSESDDSDAVNTTLDREASAAGEFFGLLGLALAYAATAHLMILLLQLLLDSL